MTRFESSVILEGSKTVNQLIPIASMFESSVILEGSKTCRVEQFHAHAFESSVILEGSKTRSSALSTLSSLRVVLF